MQGVGVIIAGLLSFLYNPFIACTILLIGFALLAVQTGISIDTEHKKYKVYRKTVGVTFGSWTSLENTTEVILVLNTDKVTLKGILPGAIPIGRSSTIQTRTYDLYITDGIKPKKLNDFLKYTPAIRAAEIISETINVPLRDKIAEKISQNQARRR